MASNYKLPPKFDGNYDVWKNELSMWELVTDLDEEKRALAVGLSLEGKAREVVLGISARTLNSEDGMKILLEALDEVFQKAAIDCA
jgi:hypothetical protein